MNRFLYDIALHGYVLSSLPSVFYDMAAKKKYRKSFLPRLGFNFPKIDKEGRPLIWIHAVSLGETKAIAPLIKKLKAHKNQPKILLTTATETGFEEGKKNGADYQAFLPLDLPYIIRPLVKKVSPESVILVESDYWFHFQDEAKKRGAKLVLMNGKLSKKTFERVKKFRSIQRGLYAPFDLLALQGNIYRERFEQLNCSQNIQVTGNIKLDGLYQAPTLTREDFAFQKSDLVLTLGSTHAPEEKLFLEHYAELIKRFPNLKLIITPRHPERFLEVSKLLEKMNISYEKMSSNKKSSVILADKMGILRSLYSFSDIAFVGGTFVEKVGGHNILEPSVYGVPVLYGPYLHSQPDFLTLMKSYEGGIEITEKTLLPTLLDLLKNENLREILGKNGKTIIEESSGSLEKSYNALIACLKWE